VSSHNAIRLGRNGIASTHNHIVLGNNRIAGSAIQMLSGDNGMGARATLAVSAKQRASAGLQHRYTVAPEDLPRDLH